uniref:Uncharacterized protein n=1 Tax=Pogona vitticeps TaxID=103695 RepID=A0ABM5F4K8_9SAUR
MQGVKTVLAMSTQDYLLHKLPTFCNLSPPFIPHDHFFPPIRFPVKSLLAAVLGNHPADTSAKDIGTQAGAACPGLFGRSGPALDLTVSLFFPILARRSVVPGAYPEFAMGCHCWLGLALLLVVAAPSSPTGDVAMTERQAAHVWAPCPQEDSAAAREEERRLTPTFSTCMLRCASRAMSGMVGNKRILRLYEGRQGEDHEFCWVLRLRCQEGERLTKAFLFFNLEQPLNVSQLPSYRLLLTTPPAQRQHLPPWQGNWATRLLSTKACGVHFDVTEPFRRAEGGQDAEMCVQAICPKEGVWGAFQLGLQCPPFLATLWRSLLRPDG